MKKRWIPRGGLVAVLLAIAAAASAQPIAPDAVQESDEALRRAFTEDDVAPRYEPAEYDVTIVKYTDYQCPFCRKSHFALAKLVEQDPRVRILYRDWPIFGEASEEAARLSIASKWQGKHAAFHDALMSSPAPLSSDTIRKAADAAGVDWSRLQADLKAHISEIDALLQRNEDQANSLGLEGTPAFIIGNTLVEGSLDHQAVSELVANTRSAAK